MSDEELLLSAAKAAGIRVQYSDNCGDFSIGEPYSKGEQRWNPLAFDKDAFRLMSSLRIYLVYPDFEACGDTVVARSPEVSGFIAEAPVNREGCRRVIVEVAAEIGRRGLSFKTGIDEMSGW